MAGDFGLTMPTFAKLHPFMPTSVSSMDALPALINVLYLCQ